MGFEPTRAGFAIPCLSHLATAPLSLVQANDANCVDRVIFANYRTGIGNPSSLLKTKTMEIGRLHL